MSIYFFATAHKLTNKLAESLRSWLLYLLSSKRSYIMDSWLRGSVEIIDSTELRTKQRERYKKKPYCLEVTL